MNTHILKCSDFFSGNIILTEIGKRNIYNWTPRTGELELILYGGIGGTINALGVDLYSSNLYYIDSRDFSIRMIDLNKRVNGILLRGNSNYIPYELQVSKYSG